MVALRAPLPDRAARDVIDAFFRAVVKEDADRLAALATSDATMTTRSHGPAPGLIEQWRTRMRSLNYEALATQRLYRPSDLELYRYEDLEAAPIGRPARPPEMQVDDTLVRVPMLVVRTGGDRVFGDELVFVLRRADGGYRVRALVEDFQTP